MWSDNFAKCSINMPWAVYSVQYVVCSVHSGAFAGASAVCNVHCAVLPAKDEDIAVETGCFKLKFYLKKITFKEPIAIVNFLKIVWDYTFVDNLKWENKF